MDMEGMTLSGTKMRSLARRRCALLELAASCTCNPSCNGAADRSNGSSSTRELGPTWRRGNAAYCCPTVPRNLCKSAAPQLSAPVLVRVQHSCVCKHGNQHVIGALMVQEGIDPSMEVIYVGGLPVDVPAEAQDVRPEACATILSTAQSLQCLQVGAHCLALASELTVACTPPCPGSGTCWWAGPARPSRVCCVRGRRAHGNHACVAAVDVSGARACSGCRSS
jgi:hypothetical protein